MVWVVCNFSTSKFSLDNKTLTTFIPFGSYFFNFKTSLFLSVRNFFRHTCGITRLIIFWGQKCRKKFCIVAHRQLFYATLHTLWWDFPSMTLMLLSFIFHAFLQPTVQSLTQWLALLYRKSRYFWWEDGPKKHCCTYQKLAEKFELKGTLKII